MMGLERLIQNTYGTTPQIDLDKQILRARVPKPTTFDFTALADGIKRANVGTAAIVLSVPFLVKNGIAVIQETGQSFKIEGTQSGGARLRILGWESPETTKAELAP